MSQKQLAAWLKGVLVCAALIGLFIYAYVLPIAIGKQYFLENYPEYSGAYVPMVVFISLSAVPCFLALYRAFAIAVQIGRDNSFSEINAKHMRRISLYALIDSIYFFAGNAVFAVLNIYSAGFILPALFIVLAGIMISIAAACLAHLIAKAAAMRKENDSII